MRDLEQRLVPGDGAGERLARVIENALARGDAQSAFAGARSAASLGCESAFDDRTLAELFERSRGSKCDENTCIELAYGWLTQCHRSITTFMPSVLRLLERRPRPWPSLTWYWLNLWIAPWEAKTWDGFASDGLAELMESTPLETKWRLSPDSNPGEWPLLTATWDAMNPQHRELAVRGCWKPPRVRWGRSLGAVVFGLIELAEMGGPWKRVLAQGWGQMISVGAG